MAVRPFDGINRLERAEWLDRPAAVARPIAAQRSASGCGCSRRAAAPRTTCCTLTQLRESFTR
jgi:hypothetical protein